MTDRGRHRGRERTDALLAAALVAGATYAEAAHAAGVSPRTVGRRLQDPAFVREMAALRAELLQTIATRLTYAAVAALDTLVELLAPGTPATVRLGAARGLLEAVIRHADTLDFEHRLSLLETVSAP